MGKASPLVPVNLPNIADLSFVGIVKGKRSRCFWVVKPSGDYGKDCQRGAELGLEYLAYEEAAAGSGNVPAILQNIVEDMPKGRISGLEVGFFEMVTYALRGGIGHAQRTRDYWLRCMKAEEGGKAQ